MCIISAKYPEAILNREILEICCLNNPDSIGMSYLYGGENNKCLVVRKFEVSQFEEFWEEFNSIQNNRAVLLHFRIASVGGKNLDNCHPFFITSNITLAHNGSLSDFTLKNNPEDKSDTRIFCETILEDLVKVGGEEVFLNTSIQFLLHKVIGGNNKLVFLDKFENFVIINEDLGEWEQNKKVWFSNKSYLKLKESSNTNSTNKNNNQNHAKFQRHKSYKNTSCKNTYPDFSLIGEEIDNNEPKSYINHSGKNGKQKFSYSLLENGDLLTEVEIQKLQKTYRCKLKILVKDGIIIKVPVDSNGKILRTVKGEKEYELYLERHCKPKDFPAPLKIGNFTIGKFV